MRRRRSLKKVVKFFPENRQDSASNDTTDDECNPSSHPSESSQAEADGYIEFRRIIKSTPSTRNLKASERASVSTILPDYSIRDDESTRREEDERADPLERDQADNPSIFSLPIGERHDMKVYCESFGDAMLHVETTPSIPIPMSTTDVVIAVEASTVSSLDVTMRRGVLKNGVYAPYVTGCDFVGTVLKCGDFAFLHGISEGDRVAAIVRGGGGNARYVTVPAKDLVHVPREVAPNEAACAVLTYLIAFQALHSGQNPPKRYSSHSLEKKRILVIGRMSLVGRAVIELSRLCGSHKVYITCPREHHERIRSIGAYPLDEDPRTWQLLLQKRIDLVVGTDGGRNYHSKEVNAVLKKSGRLVRIGTPTAPVDKASCFPVALEELAIQAVLSFKPRAAYYDIFYCMENNPDLYKSDMSHLFSLITQRRLRPHIERHILLQEVADAHNEIASCYIHGAIVCEPWRIGRGGFDRDSNSF